ncbi:MAG: hypothetical protein KDC39_07120 [Actinobacteria bacterium]|nr:hypothetical protein [Actinomycetota bacterium]
MSPLNHYKSLQSLLILLAALAAAVLVGGGLTGAQAQETYRYWSLWVPTSGSWQAAEVGAADILLSDGGVVGARYVETGAALSPSDAPGRSPVFDELCPDVPVTTGRLRVAVVIDYGDPALAPTGQQTPVLTTTCLSLRSPTHALAALSQAAGVSDSAGFISAIGGYPRAATSLKVEGRDAQRSLTAFKGNRLVSGVSTDGEIRKVQVRCFVRGRKIGRARLAHVCRTVVRGAQDRPRVSVRPRCTVGLKVQVRLVAGADHADRAVWSRIWRVRNSPRTPCER